MLKFSCAIISNRLVIERDSKLTFESYLEECFYESIKMTQKSLKIKNESYYFWNDMVYLNEFDPDLVKVKKRELRSNGDIY